MFVMTDDLDPRWEWIEVTQFGGQPEYIKGYCRHLETVPVNASDWFEREMGEPGEVVAHLCLTCNTQIAAP